MKCIRKVKLLALLAISTVATGCAGSWGLNSVSQDGITIMATGEGMSKFGRMVHGSKDPESPYWPLQHDEENTKRVMHQTTTQKLKGGAK